MNYYARHLGDYARDAGWLSMAEHGAYTLLLDWYYANERPIPRELVFSICKAQSRADKQAATKVLQSFFVWDEKCGWMHKRVEAEIAKMIEKKGKAQQSAKSRWDANAMRTQCERNANAMLSNNQYPITNNQETPSAPAGYPAPPKRQGIKAGIPRISADLVLQVVGKG